MKNLIFYTFAQRQLGVGGEGKGRKEDCSCCINLVWQCGWVDGKFQLQVLNKHHNINWPKGLLLRPFECSEFLAVAVKRYPHIYYGYHCKMSNIMVWLSGGWLADSPHTPTANETNLQSSVPNDFVSTDRQSLLWPRSRRRHAHTHTLPPRHSWQIVGSILQPCATCQFRTESSIHTEGRPTSGCH